MGKYKIADQEKKQQDFWYQEDIYAFDMENKEKKPIFSVDTPPPTISGKLHIGHISSYTQAELIARYKRMKGYNVFYPSCYDSNGIPTEILVEKELKIKIKNTDRQDFIEKCLQTIKKYKQKYENLRKSFGFSMDWSREYSTIDLKIQAIAQQRFLELYTKKSINKKEFPALRCTKNQTTIAQAETEEKEFDEFFNDIRFTLEDGTDLIIATTRPELLPACVACFVHPNDVRYQHHIGKKVTTPLGDTVPLIGDETVKMDKGTGAVMCCSYGDENDVLWIMKHRLPTKIIINRYGKIQDSGVSELDGLKVSQAREAIIPLLEQTNTLIKRTPIKQSKAISERGKAPIEIIPVHQRFVDILDHKQRLLQLNNNMNRNPEFMKKRATDWIENLQWDRNISRSRKFGIPIPVRYSKKTDEVILPDLDQLPIDPTKDVPKTLPKNHTSEDIYPENMVLDTRFTSGLSPDINQKLLEQDGSKQKILPMSLRVQAHDIIRTRLLYTCLQSMYAHNTNPFQDIMISGHVLAKKKEKISKSKGNAALAPESLHANYGADATRYRALSGQLGNDIVFDENGVKNGKKLVMKLRNAFNFVHMHVQETSYTPKHAIENHTTLYPTDQRIISQLHMTINKMTELLDKYEFGLAKITFEEFFWQDFCDTYLEIVKMRLYKPELFEKGERLKQSGQQTLIYVYDKIIHIIAPYLPHISEAIYQEYFIQFHDKKSIHINSYPTPKQTQGNYKETMESIKEIISQVRGFKGAQKLSLGAEIKSLEIQGPQLYCDLLQAFSEDVRGVTKAKKIIWKESKEKSIVCTL